METHQGQGGKEGHISLGEVEDARRLVDQDKPQGH
jgi:hypothetical protein